MKILFVATVGGFMPFLKTLTRELLDGGHEVDIAANILRSPLPECYKEWGCGAYQISCSRSPFDKGNISAITEIKKIVSDKHYDIVHCHTPIAAACTRIACRKARKTGTKVIYTAHGFHFYKGAPLKNWLIYYPLEKICSKWTDLLITINKEDYALAKKKMKAGSVEYVPGVGIDIKKFANTVVDRKEKLLTLGIPEDKITVLSVGELNENKNHKIVIEALGKLKDKNVHYIIAGTGDQAAFLKDYAEKSEVPLHLLGDRNDVAELYKIADLYVHPSIREGLPVALMEAVASGANVICSNIRGCRDLVQTGLFNPLDCADVSKKIFEFLYNGKNNRKRNSSLLEKYDTENVNKVMLRLYGLEINGLQQMN